MNSHDQAEREEKLEDLMARARIGNLMYAYYYGLLDGPEAERAMKERVGYELAKSSA